MLKNFVKKSGWRIAVFVILSILSQGLLALSTIVFIHATDNFISLKYRATVLLLILYLTVTYTSYLFDYFLGLYFEKLIQNYNHYLRSEYIRNLVTTGNMNAEVNSHVNVLTNDVYLLSKKYIEGFLSIINAVIRISLSVLALFTFHWILVLTALVAATSMLLIPKIFNKAMTRATNDISGSNESLLLKLNDWLTGLPELKFTNSKNLVWKVVAPSAKGLEDAYQNENKVQTGMDEISNGFGTLAQVGLTVVAGILSFNGIVTAGVVMRVSSFIFPIFTAFITLTNRISDHVAGQQIADKFNSVMEDNRRLDSEAEEELPSQIAVTEPAISLKNLSYHFENKTIHYPDVDIKSGSKVALMGPSGSGKSTLINILTRQLNNYEGSVSILGKEVNDLSDLTTEDLIGYLPQESHVFNVSVAENILLENEELAPMLETTLNRVNLLDTINALPAKEKTIVGSNGYALSGGEKQRLSLARALIRQKKILIVDEGTSALDEQNARDVVRTILKNKDITLLMITHTSDRELVADFDQVLTIA